MSKMVDATCSGGSVTADGVVVDGAQILSKGEGQSSGALIIEGLTKKYITSNATDLETTLEKTIDAITKIGETLTTISVTLTSIGAGMTGPTTAPPGTLVTDVAQIVSDVAELTALAGELTTLKGALK